MCFVDPGAAIGGYKAAELTWMANTVVAGHLRTTAEQPEGVQGTVYAAATGRQCGIGWSPPRAPTPLSELWDSELNEDSGSAQLSPDASKQVQSGENILVRNGAATGVAI